MAVYAIGDIHGSLKALKTIFKQGLITSADRVIFLGDYIDKGTDSKGVIDWLINNKLDFNFEFILGNHELMMKSAKTSSEKLFQWQFYGGVKTLDSYQIGDNKLWAEKIDQSHWEFIDECLPYLEIGNYIFVHAGLDNKKELSEQDEFHLFWKKYLEPEQYSPIKTVICGHTSRKNGEIADFGHTICIDTFAHGGQWLTCLNVETGEYLKANNLAQTVTGRLSRFSESME